jgi:hypothetical protein
MMNKYPENWEALLTKQLECVNNPKEVFDSGAGGGPGLAWAIGNDDWVYLWESGGYPYISNTGVGWDPILLCATLLVAQAVLEDWEESGIMESGCLIQKL